MRIPLLLVGVMAVVVCRGSEAPAGTGAAAPREHYLIRDSDDLARIWGFAPVRELGLAPDDIEIRVWRSGFVDTSGFVLERRNGEWAAFHLGPTDRKSLMTSTHGYRAAEVQPVCAFDDIFQALQSESIFDLAPARRPELCRPNDDRESCLVVVDGWAARIETRQGDRINDNLYENPETEEPDLPLDIVRAARIDHIVNQALTGQPGVIYRPHWKPVPIPGIVLVRVREQYVSAFYIKTYQQSPSGGRIEFDQRFFPETEQGFRRAAEYDLEGQVLSWEGSVPRALDDEGRFNLDFGEGGLRATLAYHPIDNEFRYEIAVPEVGSLDELTFAVLSSGFEARPAEGIWGTRTCSRVRRLEPVVEEPDEPIEAQVDTDHNLILPPEVSASGSIPVHLHGRWEPVVVQGNGARYEINDRLTVRRIVRPPPQGSDKPIVIFEIVKPES